MPRPLSSPLHRFKGQGSDKRWAGWVCDAEESLPPWDLSCVPNRVNVGCGPAEERVLLTGLHAVADIHCENCKTTLGWKYVSG